MKIISKKETSKKIDNIMIGTLYGDTATFIKNSSSSSGYTASNMSNVDMFVSRLGGVGVYPADSSLQTIVDTNDKVLLTYIILPYFPPTINASQKLIVHITTGGIRYSVEIKNDISSYFGRCIGFNCVVESGGKGKFFETPAAIYSVGGGKICDGLKVELEMVGINRTQLWASSTNSEKKMYVSYIEVDSSLKLIDPTNKFSAGVGALEHYKV